MKAFKHLDLEERKMIEKWRNKGKGIREIARALKRSVGSISDEIKRNSVKGIYTAKKAEQKAGVARASSKKNCLKVAMDKELQKYVIEKIQDEQSPEGISGRIKYIDTHITYVSMKGIYKFIKSTHGRQIERFLYSNSTKKKTGRKRGVKTSLDGRILIDQRPQIANERNEFGHFEGDFVESGRDGTGCLLILIERMTRYPFITYLTDRSTRNVNILIKKLLKNIPIKSLTLDNDISFQKHEALSELLQATIYFCHPYSPYEKGTIENRNKYIRRYAQKKSDLSSFPLSHFEMIQSILRTRYMKCLSFKTPQECFQEELLKLKNTGRCVKIKNRLVAKKCSD